MRDFEWVSEGTLRPELVARVIAGFGIFFAIACILLALGYTLYSFVFFLVSVVVAIITIIKTPPTKIRVKGNCFYYGSSIRARLENLREVRIIRQLGIEDIIVLDGAEPHILIPIKGIPEDVRSELISFLNERIDADIT